MNPIGKPAAGQEEDKPIVTNCHDTVPVCCDGCDGPEFGMGELKFVMARWLCPQCRAMTCDRCGTIVANPIDIYEMESDCSCDDCLTPAEGKF